MAAGVKGRKYEEAISPAEIPGDSLRPPIAKCLHAVGISCTTRAYRIATADNSEWHTDVLHCLPAEYPEQNHGSIRLDMWSTVFAVADGVAEAAGCDPQDIPRMYLASTPREYYAVLDSYMVARALRKGSPEIQSTASYEHYSEVFKHAAAGFLLSSGLPHVVAGKV
jgi:hypothetical protein